MAVGGLEDCGREEVEEGRERVLTLEVEHTSLGAERERWSGYIRVTWGVMEVEPEYNKWQPGLCGRF